MLLKKYQLKVEYTKLPAENLTNASTSQDAKLLLHCKYITCPFSLIKLYNIPINYFDRNYNEIKIIQVLTNYICKKNLRRKVFVFFYITY